MNCKDTYGRGVSSKCIAGAGENEETQKLHIAGEKTEGARKRER